MGTVTGPGKSRFRVPVKSQCRMNWRIIANWSTSEEEFCELKVQGCERD